MQHLENVKAIIWDLDDTLWQGSLAENDALSPDQTLIDLIPELDRSGIIQAVSSKNDAARAHTELERLGIAQYFVFSRIDFLPKGQNIAAIIRDLQLRAPNVLFIDDHPANLEEAAYYNAGLQLADPRETGLPDALRGLLKDGDHSRLDFYRLLENKQSARELFSDNQAFLRDSRIVVNLLRNPADMTYKERIVELANRSNQLNFTQSRFPDKHSVEAYFNAADSVHRHHGAIFVHDKFGHYGLVGFYGFDERKARRKLEHFYFSCRILNMGVEQAVYQHLRAHHRIAAFTPLETTSSPDSPVTVITELDAATQRYINDELEDQQHYTSAIVAGCSSGMIAHYLPESLRPARFLNFHLSQEELDADNFDHLIYALYSDYITKGWSTRKLFSYRRFARQLEALIARYATKRITLLLGSEKFPMPPKALGKRLEDALLHGKSLRRVKRCNAIARELAARYAHVSVVEMGDHVHTASDQTDPRHFERVVMQRMAQSL